MRKIGQRKKKEESGRAGWDGKRHGGKEGREQGLPINIKHTCQN